jgi:hypothetical protein
VGAGAGAQLCRRAGQPAAALRVSSSCVRVWWIMRSCSTQERRVGGLEHVPER